MWLRSSLGGFFADRLAAFDGTEGRFGMRAYLLTKKVSPVKILSDEAFHALPPPPGRTRKGGVFRSIKTHV